MDFSRMFSDLYLEKYGETVPRGIAEELVKELPVTDESDRETGEKYTFDEAVRIGDSMQVDWSIIAQSEWYLVLNKIYSEFHRTAERMQIESESFYHSLAFDWFYDLDGARGKTYRRFIFL